MTETKTPTSHEVLSEEHLRERVIARLHSMFLDRSVRENSEIIYKLLKGSYQCRQLRLDQYLERVIVDFDREKETTVASLYPNV